MPNVKKGKEVVVDLTKKHGGKTLSGATVLFLFGIVFNNFTGVDTKLDKMADKINNNHVELIKEIQNVRQEVSDDKVNYLSVIGKMFEDIREMKGSE